MATYIEKLKYLVKDPMFIGSVVTLPACIAVTIALAVNAAFCALCAMPALPAIILASLIGTACGSAITVILMIIISCGFSKLWEELKQCPIGMWIVLFISSAIAIAITVSLIFAAPSFLATAVGLVGLSTTSMVPSMIFAAIIGIIGSAILMSLLMALF